MVVENAFVILFRWGKRIYHNPSQIPKERGCNIQARHCISRFRRQARIEEEEAGDLECTRPEHRSMYLQEGRPGSCSHHRQATYADGIMFRVDSPKCNPLVEGWQE